MVKSPLQTAKSPQPAKPRPFRRAVLRGLGVVMPPLLTLVLFIWAWATIDSYVLQPLEYGIGRVVALVSMQSSVHDVIPADALPDAVKVVDKRGEPLPVADVMRAAESVNRITDVARLAVGEFCRSRSVARGLFPPQTTNGSLNRFMKSSSRIQAI